MRVAVIEQASGAVVSVVEVDVAAANDFDPGNGLVAVDATGKVAFSGCTWTEAGGFVPPLVPPPTKDELTAYAIDQRWRKEVSGITVSGISIATDDRSKQMILGARLAADLDPNWTTQWVAADGSVHPVDAAAIIAISDAVQAHVNACFVTYASIKTDIDAASITTTAEIDAAFAA